MTLEDFFTLTEMNNGLMAPSRVKELMAVMKKERDCMLNNAFDSMRQWSAVASAVAATENKDCLDLFLQLDGLQFISKWLKDAQKSGNDLVDSFVEESIIHLLRALEKLDVDCEKLVASEIRTTVQNLLVHNSPKVQDKARDLFESWKTKTDSNTSISNFDKAGTLIVDEAGKGSDIDRGIEHSGSSLGDASIFRETSINTKGHELTKDEQVMSSSSDTIHPDHVESANNMDKILNLQIGDEGSLDNVSPPSLAKPIVEPPLCHSVSTTSEPCSPAVSRQDIICTHSKLHDSESSSYTKQCLNVGSTADKLGSLEESKTLEGRFFNSSSDAVKEMKAVTERSLHRNSIAGDKKLCDETLSCIDSRIMDSDGKCFKDKINGANRCRTSKAFIAQEGGDFNHHMLPRSFSNEKSWRNHTDLQTFFTGTEDDGKANAVGLHVNDNDLASNCTMGRKLMAREPDLAGKKPNIEIDYGIVDPLEVARQVALEVQREVVDYREPSCSSSEKLPQGNTRGSSSPESVIERQSHPSCGSPKDVVDDPNLSEESSQMEEESATTSGNLDAKQTNATQDIATSQATEAAQEVSNEEKGPCNFDLNHEVRFEDSDRPGNQFSTPVSIVSASRAAAAQELPSAPLQFEGNLGWKGSAVTSAFRPASPCRMSECDKDPSTGGSRRQGCLDIDLNVDESIDPRTGELPPDKHVQLYSGVPSGESSVETFSRKSEHLGLDLNHTTEDCGSILDWRLKQFFPLEHCHDTRPHSSLSSKQPVRNIDLNDQPSYINDSSINTYLSHSQNLNISGDIKSDDSVISIMGARVEVHQKDFLSQSPALPNGRTAELAFNVNWGGTGNFLGIGSAFPYTHSSAYGYNNIAPGTSMPFPSYGSVRPIPYMVDSRGRPVVPQIVGSASALPTAFSQPPYVMNINSSTPSNGVGPSRSSFDLNSGMLMENGSKDPAGLGLFLNSTQVKSVDEHMRPNSQPTVSSVMSGKRKEPENGWEHYPFRHFTQPWRQS